MAQETTKEQEAWMSDPPPSRYCYVKHLGSGAYANVALCRDTLEWDQLVAIKVLHSHIAADAGCRERFKIEASIASSVRHPNVVSVLASGLTSIGTPFLVMEYVEGANLRDLYQQGMPFTLSDKIELLCGIAEGLRAAHRIKMTHRDIKPDNILVSERNVPRITDFGVAKRWDNDLRLTMTGDTIGTPIYMSPEQFLGGEVDARTDIYTYGAVAFELLTGGIPFAATNYQDMANLHLKATLPLLQDRKPDLPLWLNEFVQLCMQKEPEHRFQDMDEVLGELRKDRRSIFTKLFG